MATTKLRLTASKILRNYHFSNTYFAFQKLSYCTEDSSKKETSTTEQLGFAKFIEKQDEFLQSKEENLKPKTFASLLRNSTFIDLGDPVGKEVIGTVFHVVEDDLYINFGWKFHTVCKRPYKNKELYVRGAKVRLVIKDLEIASKFLGSDKEITLLEADCLLLGLASKKIYKGSAKSV